MLAKIITLRFNEALDAFDDTPLRDFLKDKETLSLRDYFFLRHDVPYLAVVVSYNLPPVAVPGAATTVKEKEKQGDEEWRKLLTPEDMPLFNALRDWRNECSRREGRPPFMVANNRQLAAIVQQRVATKTQLAAINGFGKVKCENYGADILALMREHTPPVSETPASDTEVTDNETPNG